MSLVQQVCPSCAAPVVVPPNVRQLTCPFCDTALAVEQSTGDVTLSLAKQMASTIESMGAQTEAAIHNGTTVTQVELRRLQLSQELSNVQMRLAQAQSEIRSIERATQSRVTRQQLGELRRQERTLNQQATTLHAKLYPQPHSGVKSPENKASESAQTTVGSLLSKAFSFRGRASRAVYWIGTMIAAALFAIAIATAESNETVAGCIGFPAMIAATLMYMSFAIRRYHDRGKSGWWVLIFLVPAVGPIIQLFELGFLPGTPDGDKYEI